MDMGTPTPLGTPSPAAALDVATLGLSKQAMPSSTIGASAYCASGDNRVDAVRRWAMCLCSPRTTVSELDSLGLVLPPLRPVKEFLPKRPLEDLVAQSCDDAALGRSEELKSPSVRGSRLGAVHPPWLEGLRALPSRRNLQISDTPEPDSRRESMTRANLSSVTPARARTIVSAGEAESVSMSPERRANALPGLSPRPPLTFPPARPRPPLTKMHTVIAPSDGRPKVKGTDPMASTLFGRDAVLDDASKRKGIYEGQLRAQVRRPDKVERRLSR